MGFVSGCTLHYFQGDLKRISDGVSALVNGAAPADVALPMLSFTPVRCNTAFGVINSDLDSNGHWNSDHQFRDSRDSTAATKT